VLECQEGFSFRNMMRVLIFFFSVLLTACALEDLRGTASPQLYSMDGVKLVGDGIEDMQDPATFGQASYPISPSRHLLLRFESFRDKWDSIDTSPGKKVQVQLAVLDSGQLGSAVNSLRLCPVTRNWMMLATWRLAHPFGQDGKWAQLGGDYDGAGCVQGMLPSTPDGKSILFDMTQWFTNYPRARGLNYGLILISDSPTAVAGETSGSYSPRILFDQFPKATTHSMHTR
jgi:hypothetical protein